MKRIGRDMTVLLDRRAGAAQAQQPTANPADLLIWTRKTERATHRAGALFGFQNAK